jgi:hypothetical protein
MLPPPLLYCAGSNMLLNLFFLASVNDHMSSNLSHCTDPYHFRSFPPVPFRIVLLVSSLDVLYLPSSLTTCDVLSCTNKQAPDLQSVIFMFYVKDDVILFVTSSRPGISKLFDIRATYDFA